MNTLEKYIKKGIALVCLLLVTIAYAQQGINYQGVARDASNELIINTDITLDLNIVKTNPNGESVYSETHTISTDANGVFSVVIGNGTPTLNLFEDINWAEDKHFLNVSLNGTEIGTTAFTSVPYTQAIGKWQAHKNGVTPKGTGYSIYIGDNAGENDDFTDNKNIGIGKDALQRSNSGYDNIAIGEEAMKLVTDGHGNTAIGKQALFNTSSGYDNVAIGNRALYSNSNGEANIALGRHALYNNTTGNLNIALGFGALTSNTIGESNIATGIGTLSSNTEGNNNIANGYNALRENTTGDNNIATGYEALYNNTTGNANLASGYQALKDNTIGIYNIATGFQSLFNNTEGDSNIAIGYQALYHNTTGSINIAFGAQALESNIAGNHNISIGANSGKNNAFGHYNTFVGIASGHDNTGSGNVFLGSSAGYSETESYKLYIENTGSMTPLIYGEFDNDILGFNAKVGIGTQTPAVPLHISNGTDAGLSNESGYLLIGSEGGPNIVMDNNEIQARNNGAVSTLHLQNDGGDVTVGGAVVHASDKRLKRDIANISYGLEDVLQLRPTEYFWKGKTQDYKSLGLIAQEVDEVIKNVVTYNKEQDKYGVSYTELIPVLIKALQEQQDIINSQNKTIQGFEERLSALEGGFDN